MKNMAAGMLFLLFAAAVSAQSPINIANIKIRVERPDRVRNPIAPGSSNCYDGKDNIFNEIEITPGTFYGYTANGSKTTTVASTCFAKGGQPYGMGSTAAGWFGPTIYPSNNYNSTAGYGSCGLWLQGTYLAGTTYYGFAHTEGYSSAFPSQRQCNYPPTTKSMALLTSSDGLNWSLSDQIISNPNGDSSGTEFGEGDCTPVPFSGFVYLYCRRTSDFKTSVARAANTSNFTHGSWIKYNGSWSPGAAWNADDSPLGSYGNSSSLYTDPGTGNQTIVLMNDEITSTAHGLLMSFSANATSVSSLTEPVLYEDDHTFPHASTNGDLVIYASAISPTDGSHSWGSSGYFLLTYTYVPNWNDSGAANSPSPAPDSGRTLVMRDLNFSVATSAQTPHVGVAISRWRNPDIGLRISSTEAVPYNFETANVAYETRSGYIMTVPPTSDAAQIWECVNKTWPSTTNPDHTFTFANSTECSGTGAGYNKVRTAGWLYNGNDAQPPNTVPVYRCKSTATGYAASTHFASTGSSCEGLGTVEFLLGYGLAN